MSQENKSSNVHVLSSFLVARFIRTFNSPLEPSLLDNIASLKIQRGSNISI